MGFPSKDALQFESCSGNARMPSTTPKACYPSDFKYTKTTGKKISLTCASALQ